MSYRFEGPLDLRMDPEEGTSAVDLLDEMTVEELSEVLREYGEERRHYAIARAVIEARDTERMRTTADLVRVVERFAHPRYRTKTLARVFQALRIRVNDELGALAEALPGAASLLAEGGRLAVVSYHSLEDRVVKRFFREASKQGEPGLAWAGVPRLTRPKGLPVRPGDEECERNGRARSAKLRWAERERE